MLQLISVTDMYDTSVLHLYSLAAVQTCENGPYAMSSITYV